MSPIVHLIAHNYTDHTITLAIDGKRHEYWLTPSQCDTMEHLCRRISGLRALAYAKSRHRPPKTVATST